MELSPNLSRAWDAWGRMETSQFSDIARAKELFSAGLKADPWSHRLWHAYGIACDRLGLPDEAARAFDAGLKIQPSNPFLLVAKVRSWDMSRPRERWGTMFMACVAGIEACCVFS